MPIRTPPKTSAAKRSRRTTSTKMVTSGRSGKVSGGTYKYSVPRGIVDVGFGFPRMLKTTLKYAENINILNAAAGGSLQTFSCNSLYDPNITGTGHQPMYFDQLIALYDHYCVVASKFTVVMTGGDGNVTPLQYCLCIDDDATLNAGPIIQAEYPDSNFGILPTGVSAAPTVRTLYWSARKFFGKDPIGDPELQGTASTSPTEQSTFNISVQPMDGIASTIDFNAAVIIEYTCVFKELKNIQQS
ncbi:Cap [Chicken proventriculitis-associated circular virus 4]|nr:Cap [Chicken proventriculitis-associated circular virus 4]